MKKKIDCPYCDGHALLAKELRDMTYRKESYSVFGYYYKCNLCNKEFTTIDTDTVTLNQAHNQYRETYGIPFVDEISSTREKYDLSATKMCEVLGLGVNSYSNFENGEVPSVAIGNLISTAKKPTVFLDFVEKSKHYFTANSFEKLIDKVKYLIKKEEEVAEESVCIINQFEEPNQFTGYKKTHSNKIANLLTIFISENKRQFNDRLKLNKLFFYLDFGHYKKHGFSITGLSYRAIQYGPVPTFYDNIFTFFENEQVIESNWEKDSNGAARENFTTRNNFDDKVFLKEEIETINEVINTFRDIPSWDLVELSHKERAWIELEKTKGIISYQTYAFDIQGI